MVNPITNKPLSNSMLMPKMESDSITPQLDLFTAKGTKYDYIQHKLDGSTHLEMVQ
jgi:hypothetical protein